MVDPILRRVEKRSGISTCEANYVRGVLFVARRGEVAFRLNG
jgi:hypothetical protein